MGSSITGILDKRGRDVFRRILSMLSATEHRGSANIGIAIMGKSVCETYPRKLDEVHLSGHIGIGVIWNGVEKKFGQANDSFHGILDGELYGSEEAKKCQSKKTSETRSSIETMIHLLRNGISEQLRWKDSERLMHQKLRAVDGVFALAILHENRIFVTRDIMGVKPLYIGEDENVIAFCSEKKGLWSIGLKKIRPLDPGSFAIIDRDNIHIFRGSWRFRVRETKLEESVSGLGFILRKAVEKRVEKHDPVGLLFSGGLDSTILAKIVKDSGKDLDLFCAGTGKGRDVVRAKRIADLLDLPLRIKKLTSSNIEHHLAEIVFGIETNDYKAIAIGIPVYFAGRLAKDHGIDTVLSGQGADELFGGYARYLITLKKKGYDGLQKVLEQDVGKIAELNVHRDDHASNSHGVQIQLPYLDWNVVKFGHGISTKFKIRKRANKWSRKFVLRRLAENMNLPKEVCWGPKVAMQYGSGSEKILKKIAKAKGFSKSFAKRHGYLNHIQLFFDCVAKQAGIPVKTQKLESIIRELDFAL